MTIVRPMLADKADLTKLRYPLYASPKLDGIRGFAFEQTLLSRTLKKIPNRFVQAALAHTEINGFDGELIVGPPAAEDVYRRTTSAVMSHEGEPNFKFYVFDMIHGLDVPWSDRFAILKERWKALPYHLHNRIEVLNHRLIDDEAQLLAYEEERLELGYEGLILRDPFGKYKYGRATVKEGWLLKLKRFEDAEAEIIGVEEEMHNGNVAEKNELGRTKRSSALAGQVPKGTLGALIVRDLTSAVEFKIGTGFDAAQRTVWWGERHRLPGRIVKYKHFPIGVKSAPRHPVFLGFRDRSDL